MTLSRLYSACLVISFIVIFGFAGYTLFYKLGHEAFQDYDEATYAQVTSESLAHGNYVSLTYLNAPYFRKPPFLFWATTASQRFLHNPEFSDRLPSALAGLLAIFIVLLICLEANAGMPAALLGAAVLATTASWMEFARDVRFDNLVTLFISVAFYFGIRATRDGRWYVAVGIALALGFLSKDIIVVFAGVGILTFTLLEIGGKRTLQLIRTPYLWAGIAAFLIVCAPWHVLETIRFGSAFWNSYLGTEVVERASTNLFPGGDNPTNAQYALYLAQFASPWSEIFLVSLISLAGFYKKIPSRIRNVLLSSIATVLAVLLVMGTAQTKAYGYLVPLYPFMAVVIALTAYTLALVKGEMARAALYGAFLVFVPFAAYLTVYDALHINPYYGWEIGHAQEERSIGLIIANAPDPAVFAYNYDDIGSILYYSHLPFTANPYVLLLSASSTPPANSFVLANTSVVELQKAFPKLQIREKYYGRFVSLFVVTN